MGIVNIQETNPMDKRNVKKFAVLERKLLSHYPLYVSYFDNDIISQFSSKSAYTQGMSIQAFIASDGIEDVARCAAMINPRYQEAKKENVGFIGYFAAAEGYGATVTEMFTQAESWLKSRQVSRVIAPFNGSAMLGYGLLTDGYEDEPILTNGWNPPYYVAYFEQAGYRPAYPLLVYTTDFNSLFYRKEVERAKTSKAFKARSIDMKRWRADLEIFRELTNEGFKTEWEWYPLNEDEFYETFNQIKPIYDPELMMMAEVDGKPAGISIGIPNWNPLIRICNGKRGIPEYMKFLLHGKHYETGGHVIASIKPEFAGMGIGRSMVALVCNRYEELGLKKAFGYTINVDNKKSRRMNEALGGTARLLYHVYDKGL
jgi:GNAT superfamily N-acetyltransferase